MQSGRPLHYMVLANLKEMKQQKLYSVYPALDLPLIIGLDLFHGTFHLRGINTQAQHPFLLFPNPQDRFMTKCHKTI